VKVSRVPDIDEFLDPKSLTPQELYTLQSEAWAQGAEAAEERIIKLLEQNETLFRQYVAYEALVALIKGEQK
jgi:hypothetical protein